MPDYRCTMYFECKGAGWSHTFYRQSTTLGEAVKETELLADRHLLMMSSQVKMSYIRVSNVADRRQTRLIGVDTDGSIVDEPADMPWTGPLVQLRTANNDKRSLVLHGVPDAATVQSWRDPPNLALFRGPYLIWKNWFLAHAWRMRLQNTGQALVPIDNITVNAAGKIQVTTTGAHGLAANQLVRFNGTKTVPSLTGSWKASKVDATSFILPKTNLNHLVVVGQGSVRPLGYIYEVINLTEVIRVAKRDLGRPFDPQRGFRRTAKIHASP